MSRSAILRLAGRLVLGRIPALTLENEHRQALADGTMGGITLFKENVLDLEQLAKLTGDIIEASYHPAVLTVDQEGGAVQRFDSVISPLPSPMALASLADDISLEAITEISCRQLKKIGFNMLLAPTLDLQSNPKNPIICTRAFGDDPEKVSDIGAKVAAAIEATGLIAVGKHFPGHGSTSEDSHLQLATVDKSLEQLMASDMVPFARLAQSLKAILIGHIWLPQLVDNQCPATLSKILIEKILRQKLGFKGLVVSDDMIMKAISQEIGLGEACVRAFLAGVDLLLVCGTFDQSKEAVEAIADAVEAGRISQERLHQAVARLDALIKIKPAYLDASNKKALAQFQETIAADTIVSREVSARAISVLRGYLDQATLDYTNRQNNITVIAPEHARYPLNLALELKLALEDKVAVIDLRYPLNPAKADIDGVISDLSGLVIYMTYRSALNEGQSKLAERLAAKTNPAENLIHVACDAPYDIDYLPGFENITSLATFDPSCQAMAALADVLTGKVRAEGHCPVKLASPDRAAAPAYHLD